METPIPTPYDILPLPVFAWVPGVAIWALVALILFLGFFLVKWICRSPRSEPQQALLLVRTELQALASSDLPGSEVLGRLSLVLRRYFSVLAGRDLSSLSLRELERSLTSKNLERQASLANLLLGIERRRYSPDTIDLAQSKQLVSEAERLSAQVEGDQDVE